MQTHTRERPKRNMLAVVSLGLGLLCPIITLIFGIHVGGVLTTSGYVVAGAGVLAVLTGFVAFQQIRRSGESGIGSAVLGMFFGGLALLAVLITVVVLRPYLEGIREQITTPTP